MHFLRDLTGHCRKDQHDALGAVIRQLFTAPDGQEARRRLTDTIAQLEPRAAEDRQAARRGRRRRPGLLRVSAEHWPKLRSTNPLERFNREIGRRTDVVDIFPDDPSLIRLVSMLAIKANDECSSRAATSATARCRLSTTSSPINLSPRTEEVAELAAA